MPMQKNIKYSPRIEKYSKVNEHPYLFWYKVCYKCNNLNTIIKQNFYLQIIKYLSKEGSEIFQSNMSQFDSWVLMNDNKSERKNFV